MKKLMIAACAVALAGVAQAANIDWAIAAKAFELSNGTKHPNGQMVYLVNTSVASWSDWDGKGMTALQALATGALIEADIEDQSFWAGSATTYANADETKTAFKNGYAKVTGAIGDGDGVTLTADKYAILIFDSVSQSPDTYYMVSGVADGKGYVSNPDDGVSVSFNSAAFASGASLSGGWQQVSGAAPEPTSGLLLLLGVAGLALRRRRA